MWLLYIKKMMFVIKLY